MQDIFNAIAASPALAWLGAGVLLLVLFAPIALKIAGLSGAQIVELLRTTAAFAVNFVVALRCEDEPPK